MWFLRSIHAHSNDGRIRLHVRGKFSGRLRFIHVFDEVTGANWSLDVNDVDSIDPILNAYTNGGYLAMTDAMREHGAVLLEGEYR